MEQTEQIDALAEALAAATAGFQPITESRTAIIRPRDKPEYSYKYATLQDCIAATRPALSAQGLAVVQLLDTTPEGFSSLTTQLVHRSGQWIRSHFLIPVANVQEPRSIGSGLTYVRRYTYCAVLGIASEEDDDGAGAGRKPGARPEPAARPSTREQQPRPNTAPAGQSSPAEPYRIKSGEFQGKTLQEIWNLGEKGQEFVKKCAEKGMGPTIRDQAKQVVEKAAKTEPPAPENKEPVAKNAEPAERPRCFGQPLQKEDAVPPDVSPDEFRFCLEECPHRNDCIETVRAGCPAFPG